MPNTTSAACTTKAKAGEDHDKAVQARDMLAAIMTPAQIVEAQKLTRELHFCTHPWVRF